MTPCTLARRWLPGIAVLLVANLCPVATAETEAPSSDELCQRVFDAIDEPAVTFGLESHALRPAAYAALDRVINFSRNCPQTRIIVIGHSDALGDESFNVAISRLRAQAVADYLMRGGVRADRLRVIGRGSSEPVADNETRSGRARNRRIELVLAAPNDGE